MRVLFNFIEKSIIIWFAISLTNLLQIEIVLKYTHIDSQVYGFAAKVSIEQIFCNIDTKNIELKAMFFVLLVIEK